MQTRAATRSNRASSFELSHVAEGSNSPGRAGLGKRSHDGAPEVRVDAGLFPRLDDDTARNILSHLPSASLANSSLVSKAWLALSSDDSFWSRFLTSVDPMSALGHTRLRELSLRFSYKQVVSELSTRLCSLCQEPTNGFFLLTGTRVCLRCFRTDKRVKMCSLSYAKSHFLLSKSQESKMPKLRVENASETGCVATKNTAITLTTCSAAEASAVARWGSEEAFREEMARRTSKAESSFEARKRAYAQRATGPADSTSAGPKTVNNGVPTAEQALGDRLPHPSYPRILKLGSETNYVGSNQQEYNSVRGEKYGFFTVVNDAFFDSGPKVTIAEYPDIIEDGEEIGRRLSDALERAEPGTTIELAASCELEGTVSVNQSVRIIGNSSELLTCGGALLVNAPCIARSLSFSKFLISYDCCDDHGEESPGYSLRIEDDSLLECCRFNTSSPSASMLVRLGRLVARRNTFRSGEYALVVHPFSNCDHLETSVILEGNTFSRVSGWCIWKGPARCHPQDDASILAANDFPAVHVTDRIRAY